MKVYLKLFVFLMVFNLFSSNVYGQDNIDINVKSAILIDQETGRVLYEKNPDEQRACASLTKMMTFLIALESIEKNKVSKYDIVKISKKAARTRGSTYGLKYNEKVKFIDLMKGLMVVSGNDAAVAIAEYIGGDTKTFVDIMNNKAKEIGMNKTFFINPHGLPVYGINKDMKNPKENMSCARDLSILAKYLLDNYKNEVLSITKIKTYINPERNFIRNNTNALLRIMNQVDGIKTGFTGRAGYCLAFTMNVLGKEDNDFRVIGIVLGATSSKNRTIESKKILEYVKNNFIKKRVIKKGDFIGKVYLYGIDKLEIKLKAKNDLWIVKNKKEKIKRKVILDDISCPVKKGDKVGRINYIDQNGNVIANVDLVSDSEIKFVPLNILFKIFVRQILN
ncbi:D-alanyl-D-alanine carboxypeptidase family protein [Tepidibacter thalassicus]|uniref:serine-type D-Ala-D-Ala carboxypeptidase n=1 Tax=Tepidibacter thalassicus DSM 15285 TaxID=1123350 RepID=A0A1M5NRN3_9FIRM|nr:D-alanyl-D-alanine carboxypeptidase family protein [Tepidibacter thalassicus]SHG92160.1 D-alanyl-D-alanine carboxypeptidase [Tepidibacter thalassicus DSM 15285]